MWWPADQAGPVASPALDRRMSSLDWGAGFAGSLIDRVAFTGRA